MIISAFRWSGALDPALNFYMGLISLQLSSSQALRIVWTIISLHTHAFIFTLFIPFIYA